MMKKEKIWVRVAGNGTKIKAGDSQGWRCFFRDTFEEVTVAQEISLSSYAISGVVSDRNYVPGTNAKGDVNGIIAWFDVYCDAVIDGDNVLHMALLDPSQK